jgi:signal peptidase I
VETGQAATPRPWRRLTRWTTNTVLFAVTLAGAAWLLPSLFGLERYVITGGSMSGTFEKGSLAFEREVPVAELRTGDVITYQPPAGAGTTDLVTHRIVRITRDDEGLRVFRTKGDANAGADPWTFRLQQPTQPVVEFTVPLAGHVLIALADRETRMLVIGGPAALVALWALVELIGAVRPRRRGTQPGSAVAPSRLPTANEGDTDGVPRMPVGAAAGGP